MKIEMMHQGPDGEVEVIYIEESEVETWRAEEVMEFAYRNGLAVEYDHAPILFIAFPHGAVQRVTSERLQELERELHGHLTGITPR